MEMLVIFIPRGRESGKMINLKTALAIKSLVRDLTFKLFGGATRYVFFPLQDELKYVMFYILIYFTFWKAVGGYKSFILLGPEGITLLH